MSQLTLVVVAVVVSDAEALAEGLGLTRVPRGTWLRPELLEPAWKAITPPITRPSAAGTASWTAIRATASIAPPLRSRRHTLGRPGGRKRQIKPEEILQISNAA